MTVLTPSSPVTDATPTGAAAVRPVQAPPLWLRVFEQRVVFEAWAFHTQSRWLTLVAPRGDGHPVLVLPGFTGSDAAIRPLRRLLGGHGYAMAEWGLGRNLATPEILDGAGRHLAELHERYEAKVSLVGISAGGIQARDLARDNPSAVRQVVTLASPFRFSDGDGTGVPATVVRRSRPSAPPAGLGVREEDRPPVPVPTSSIYSRSDGIIRWHLCIDADGPMRENIEVRGSHCGIQYNLAAVFAIADRLAQPDGSWAPFRPHPGMKWLYPTADVWRAAGNTRDEPRRLATL